MYERQEERLSPLPKIGEGFGEWSEAFLARKVGWSVKGVLGIAKRQSRAGVDGSPEACLGKKCRAEALQEPPWKGGGPREVSLDDETSLGLEGELDKVFLPWFQGRKGGFTFLVVDVKTRQRSEGT